MAQHSDKSSSNDILQVRCHSDFKQDVREATAEAGYNSMSEYVRDVLRTSFTEGPHSEISESMQESGTSEQSGDFSQNENDQDLETTDGQS